MKDHQSIASGWSHTITAIPSRDRHRPTYECELRNIGIELIPRYDFSDLMAASMRAEGVHADIFQEEFPETLLSGNTGWILWSVRFGLDQLVLYYYSREQIGEPDTDGFYQHKGQATVIVKQPHSLGLRFVVPAIPSDDLPERVYRCTMSEHNEPKQHSRTMTLTERYSTDTAEAEISLYSVRLPQSDRAKRRSQKSPESQQPQRSKNSKRRSGGS